MGERGACCTFFRRVLHPVVWGYFPARLGLNRDHLFGARRVDPTKALRKVATRHAEEVGPLLVGPWLLRRDIL